MFDTVKLQQAVVKAIRDESSRRVQAFEAGIAPEALQPACDTEARRQSLQALGRDLAAVQTRCARLQSDIEGAQAMAALLLPAAPLMQDVHEVVVGLKGSTRRFAVVIDLMVSAAAMLDAQTYAVACACVQSHVARSGQQLADAERLLSECPQLPKSRRARALS